MSFWRKSLFYSALMMLQAASLRIAGLIASGLTARMLTPSDWGSVQAITTVAGTLGQTLKLSVDGALQVRIAETGELRPGDHSREQLLGSAICLVTLLVALALIFGTAYSTQAARLFGDASLSRFMWASGVLAALQLANQLSSVATALGNYRAFTAVSVCAALANVLLIAVPYALGMGGRWIVLSALLVSQAIISLLGVAVVLRTARQHALVPRFDKLGSASLELIRLGLPLHLAGAVPAAVALFLNAKVARLSGMESLATLRVVVTVNQLVAFAPGALAATFLSQLARLRGSAGNVPTTHFLRYLRLIAASALISALATAIIKFPLVRALFGAKYEGSASLLDLGLISITLMVVKQSLVVGLISERRTGYALTDSLVTTFTAGTLGQLLIPRLQAEGYLLAEVLGHLTALVLLLALFSRRLRGEGRSRELLTFLGLLVAGLAMLAASHLTRASGPHVLPLTSGLLLLLWAVAFLLFTREERERGRQELRHLLSRLRRQTPGA